MKKVFFITILFILSIILFIFTNRPKVESVSYTFDEKESYFDIKFDNLKSIDLVSTLEGLDIQILEIDIDDIIKYKYIPTTNNLKEISQELINNYKELLIENGYEEESVHYDIKGFNINSIKLLGLESELKKFLY